MPHFKKEDIKQEVFDLYDDYAHNRLSRREFMENLSVYAVGGIIVSALMSFLTPDYKNAVQVSPNNPALNNDYITYPSPQGGGSIRALLSVPKNNNKKLGGVVIVHENRGLNPYIEDVARRAALAGFVSLAPDALSPLGGYPGNDDEGRTLQSKRDRNEMLEDFIAGFNYLAKHEFCNGRVGVIGFCFGGWVSNMMAVKVPELAAAVPYYGGQPPIELVPAIKAPLLLHFASLDARVNEGWPAYEQALKDNNKAFTAFMYPGVNHGFHNDTTPRYDEAAAKLSWERTVGFCKKYLD